ncbi:MAG: protein-export membrane protein SecF [Candidatus Nealsonbacteria bacterium RIFCSPHIGHO2_01_FULL_43_31]|uniref:Protein-export membrane protein SecF n=2 Tax=Candidatus Nealsoniibacteriota TaxID=1817911 RepID=A0A1G2E732_9BACT|nr:MAG: protein-export membrane protein SecF [Candidatus Nealsonbacteria bacterium RIFCSPHIGHO2_01_FULL_43_31]OGZ21432.1 MAG: protein-export membrane protein SecF [Candidatus Nealsonbacteria bacterium RIFCSPHIGHO2_02_FULL_43_13]
MQVNFIRYSKIYFVLGGILMLASIAALIVWGLKPGIDFTGGSILEVSYLNSRIANEEIEQRLAGLKLDSLSVQSAGEKSIIIRTKYINEETHQAILSALRENQSIEERRFESVGSVIGRELKQKTFMLVFACLLAIVFYIALAFRKVRGPVKAWQYALSSLISLFHDILIPLGIFAVLGKFYGVEISIPVVTALLTVIGCSINNVVVVFDRIRENTIRKGAVNFGETVNASINQTLGRCLSTTFVYLLPLAAIFFFGGETLKYFALALIIGIIAGTISAVFLASPVLVFWGSRKKLG